MVMIQEVTETGRKAGYVGLSFTACLPVYRHTDAKGCDAWQLGHEKNQVHAPKTKLPETNAAFTEDRDRSISERKAQRLGNLAG